MDRSAASSNRSTFCQLIVTVSFTATCTGQYPAAIRRPRSTCPGSRLASSSSRRSGGCWRAKAAGYSQPAPPWLCIGTSDDPADRAQDTAAPGGQRLQVRSQLTGGARPVDAHRGRDRSMRGSGRAPPPYLATLSARQRADARQAARAHDCESRGLLSGRASQVFRRWGVSSGRFPPLRD